MKRTQADHLTDDEVAELNRMMVAGYNAKVIAAHFNISVRIAQSRIAAFAGRAPRKVKREPRAFMPIAPKPAKKEHPVPNAIPSVLSKIRGGRA